MTTLAPPPYSGWEAGLVNDNGHDNVSVPYIDKVNNAINNILINGK